MLAGVGNGHRALTFHSKPNTIHSRKLQNTSKAVQLRSPCAKVVSSVYSVFLKYRIIKIFTLTICYSVI